MREDIKKLVDAFTDRDMTGEGRASVLGYARGRLDAQRESRRQGCGAAKAKKGPAENIQGGKQ